MNLPIDLVKRFSKVMKNQNRKEWTVANGMVAEEDEDGVLYVQLDGSDTKTPVEMLVDAEVGDRVAVQIKDHKATIVDNYTAPPSSRSASKYVQMTDDGLLIGDLFGLDGTSLVVGSDKLYINNADGEQSFLVQLNPVTYSDGQKRYGFRVTNGQNYSYIIASPEAADSNYMGMSTSMSNYTNIVTGKNGNKGYTQTGSAYAYQVSGNNDAHGYRVNWNGDITSSSLDSGEIMGLTVSAGSTTTGHETFNHAFTSAPIVVAGFCSEPTGSPVSDFGKCTVTTYNITKTGFDYKVCNGGSSARSPRISWIASNFI